MRLLEPEILAPHKAAPFSAGVDSRRNNASAAPSHTVYFDASCGMCSAGARRFSRILSPRGFVLAPLQDRGVSEMLGLPAGEIPDEMKLRTRDGTILGGVDALLFISRRIWWAWPAWAVSFLPGGRRVLRALYRRIAQNRHRLSGACRI